MRREGWKLSKIVICMRQEAGVRRAVLKKHWSQAVK
jgi:hypothetical protein